MIQLVRDEVQLDVLRSFWKNKAHRRWSLQTEVKKKNRTVPQITGHRDLPAHLNEALTRDAVQIKL